MTLEPIDPETAVELYLTERETELASTTLSSHRSRLEFFTEWCDEQDIENLNELTGRKLHEFRLWRRNTGDLAPPSEKSQMDTLRVFVRWLGTIDGVDPELYLKVRSPSVNPEDEAKDVMLESDAAEQILQYLQKYEYASIQHVTVSLLWHTMMRRGAAHALDVEDYNPEEQYLEVVNRPDTGTRLKNGNRGERLIALSGDQCLLLDDWIRNKRPDVTDEYGRRPLLATSYGRIALSTIQKYVYRATRPCCRGDACPHSRDPEDCEAMVSDRASTCPSSVGPHAIRRGSITNHLNSDIPETAVGDRANVSSDVLEKHYDRRNKKEKMEQRRKYLDNI
ncbi:tyrosine-type recombinase/integrase [Halobellus salinisoli]|uniref:tyrosine-type recombinase/integrase n=1 Tax=Halobellus salinisoli TaxID=3108500 RepID=UPI0030093FDC